jgi:hypothetical protein
MHFFGSVPEMTLCKEGVKTGRMEETLKWKGMPAASAGPIGADEHPWAGPSCTGTHICSSPGFSAMGSHSGQLTAEGQLLGTPALKLKYTWSIWLHVTCPSVHVTQCFKYLMLLTPHNHTTKLTTLLLFYRYLLVYTSESSQPESSWPCN